MADDEGVSFSDTFDRSGDGALGAAWTHGVGNAVWTDKPSATRYQSIGIRRDAVFDPGPLMLYGRMPDGSGPDDPKVGAILTADSRCTRCNEPFLQGHCLTADLGPNMSGTARHTDCDDPKLENQHDD